MSTSESAPGAEPRGAEGARDPRETAEAAAGREDLSFAAWVAGTFAARGAFTALIVLLARSEGRLSPLCSTTVNVVGPVAEWDDMVVHFAGSGRAWEAAAFLPRQTPHKRPLDPPATRLALRELEARLGGGNGGALAEAFADGALFDRDGRRFRVPSEAPAGEGSA